MYTAARIRRYIFKLNPDTIFSTRELLNCGKRAAVDKCLSRLVKSEQIIRLARGIFRRFSGCILPSAFVVAENKARAFGKNIIADELTLATSILSPDIKLEQKIVTYSCSGHSSKFKFGKIVIRLHGECSRKMHLANTEPGLALRALWSMGSQSCDQIAIVAATNNFTRQNRYEIRQLAYFIPAWLSDKLCYV